MTISLTLTFASLDELHEHLARVATPPRIAHVDRPDVGVTADEKPTVLAFDPVADARRDAARVQAAFDAFAAPSFTDPVPSFPTPFNPFAAAGVVVAPVPPAPPAPSTAVVAALPTAPEAPPATLPTLPVAGVPPAPPPAPEAAVPAAPVAPASPAGIAVDVDGLPWDARIHAGGRATNADGRWRQKRGLNDPALKARVEAELRQAMGAPAAAVTPSVPTPLPVPPAPTPAPTAAVPAPPTTTVPSLEVPSAPTGEPFPVFMARVGSMLVNGKLAQEQLNALLAECGLTSPVQLGVRPDLIPALAARIDAVAA